MVSKENRRRLIVVEGDGQMVTRTAHEYNATAVIYLAHEGASKATSQGPAVRLEVGPDGTWTVYEIEENSSKYGKEVANGKLIS